MKKEYSKPTLVAVSVRCCQLMTTSTELGIYADEGVTPEEAMSRRHGTIWDDDDE